MSRIDTLIRKNCPNGVEFRQLGSLLEPTKNIQWSQVPNRSYKYIDLTSLNRITHQIGDTDIIDNETAPSRARKIVRENDVIFGTTRPTLMRYCQIPADYHGEICSTGFCVLRPKTALLHPEFLLHIVGTTAFLSYVRAHQRGASYPAISDRDVKAFPVPLPRLKVQCEVAKVLGSFSELEAVMEAELEARRKQYRYYRDALFTFDEPSLNEQNVPWLTLAELTNYQKIRIRNSQLTEDSYVGVDNLLPEMRGKERSSFTPTKGSSIEYEAGDLLIGNIRPYLKKIWLANSPGGASPDVLVIRLKKEQKERVLPRFLYHSIASDSFFAYDMQHARGAKMPRGDKDAIMRYRVRVPSIEEQIHAVSILDKFDSLVNDLSSGLPAEIDARRKQYEHYCNRLLTFNKAV